MGISYEINWYLVAEEENVKKISDNNYVTVKKENRIYPVSAILPYIIKNVGCISMAKILSFEISENETKITFELVDKYKDDKKILDHYYDMYLDK